MLNVEQTFISQFANSPVLAQLVENLNAYIDPATDFDAFYALIWNIDTAEGYGLDVWGRIVGVGRAVRVPIRPWFGFAEAGGSYALPLNQGTFYDGTALTTPVTLGDEAYRTLIFAKALANICDGSIPAFNRILQNLFPARGNCYVRDNLNMTLTYIFEFTLTATEIAILSQSGVLPRPVGVAAKVVQV